MGELPLLLGGCSLVVFNGLCGWFIGLREMPLVCVVLLRLHVDVGLLAVRG